jgi:GxxExxY protein
VFTAENAESAEMMEGENLNRITESIIGAATPVRRAPGPGLLESAYEACLAFELAQRGLKVEQQKPLPVVYREVKLDCGYRLDLLVEETVIVEVKAVDRLMPIHQAQLLSYLKLSGCSLPDTFHRQLGRDIVSPQRTQRSQRFLGFLSVLGDLSGKDCVSPKSVR